MGGSLAWRMGLAARAQAREDARGVATGSAGVSGAGEVAGVEWDLWDVWDHWDRWDPERGWRRV